MSSRYGIGVSLEPGFTAGAHRARQVVCAQYSSWAAEMHMVYLPLFDYFRCADDSAASLEASLSSLAARSREQASPYLLARSEVAAVPGPAGHIFLTFQDQGGQPALRSLRDAIAGLLAATPGTALGAEEEFQPRLPLLQYARLPASVFDDAAEFAREVVDASGLSAWVRVRRLLLFRFESEAAGEDWSQGGWAADLRWELLASHPL